ncbi:dual specificity protein phosphatase family protein [Pseudoroseicyclus aestuarii]|uniref:Tyrosine phosphatase family protein n=1 Tax=Pseudoroseicyclus aestuarii TaxID=1795041 RepID=A0A318STG7_9RHOB|nr:dual specificity protein phosphatase family protein [Pseudoroseicyclus aestuarii]PYE82469.1 tyrosine phosphatase family protein [Pseudoroseicyclus aestuarii]
MKPLLRRAAVACSLCLAVPGGYLGYLQASGNFHPVVVGEAYRSAQPDAADLRGWVQDSGIRSVINLRGAHEGTAWYDEEVAASNSLGLAHYDFAMSASKGLDRTQAAALIALLRDAPKPVLIHCMSGADRSGLASALYLADHGQDEEVAEAQISFRYGHISLPHTAAWPIDQSWEALEGWLGYAS